MDLVEQYEEVKKTDEAILKDIVEKTSKIHASFLFWGPVNNLLKQLSMNLCATPISLRYNSWPELGVKLGLEQMAVKSIENMQIMKQDPVYIMLLAYSQKPYSTIANIYIALSELERKDVIRQTHSTLVDFHKNILLQFTIPNDGILRPPNIPEAPHIFQNIEPEQTDNKKTTTKSKTGTKLFKKVILLTYVPENKPKEDKQGIVEKVVKEFRKEINGKSIGVLMLEEHRKEVLQNSDIVQAFYKCANYIIPILTTDYLTHIASSNNSMDNLDGNYAKYIYSNMMLEYLNSGCKNKKVRCIIPDDHFENVQKHYFFQPLFQAWTKESDISKMAKRILDGKI